jgi:hypothetical protein
VSHRQVLNPGVGLPGGNERRIGLGELLQQKLRQECPTWYRIPFARMPMLLLLHRFMIIHMGGLGGIDPGWIRRLVFRVLMRYSNRLLLGRRCDPGWIKGAHDDDLSHHRPTVAHDVEGDKSIPAQTFQNPPGSALATAEGLAPASHATGERDSALLVHPPAEAAQGTLFGWTVVQGRIEQLIEFTITQRTPRRIRLL